MLNGQAAGFETPPESGGQPVDISRSYLPVILAVSLAIGAGIAAFQAGAWIAVLNHERSTVMTRLNVFEKRFDTLEEKLNTLLQRGGKK